MSQLTSERFIEMVAKSGLVDPVAEQRLLDKVRDKLNGSLPESPKRLASAYKHAGLLTEWHIEKLLAGKYKGFFLGKYKLLGHIATGGMSSVYLAEHTRMHDKRAIKVLPKARVKDASYLARFQLEAQAIASLNHPNIVLAYDIDNIDDVHFIVMEYVEGVDLQALVKRDGPLDFAFAADLIAQAAHGLHHAHSKGVIHRDVKPANLLLDLNNRVRLLDMGLALVTAGDNESLTVANNENVLGTADYLAPEQALNSHTVDHRADIYSLGCTLYYLITGKPLFSDGTLAQRILRHQSEMPKDIRSLRADCPGELAGICVKMIQKDPAYRYQTANDVAEVLEKFAATTPKDKKVTVKIANSLVDNAGSDSSSISIGDDKKSKSSIQNDTVTNKNDDTLTGSSSSISRINELSSGDSGRLVEVRTNPNPSESIEGSFIDLEVESGYRGRSKKPKNSGPSIGKSLVNSEKVTAVQSGIHSSDDAGASRVANSGRKKSSEIGRQGFDPLLIGALLTALFIVAIAIGFFLARVTS